MPTTHIALIGEQPIPILLPARHLNADRTILVHTGRSAGVARRLARLIPDSTLLETPPYALYDIVSLLNDVLPVGLGIDGDEQLIFNLTGGTKIMVLAAYTLATQHRADFIYLQSEGRQSVLRRYAMHDHVHTLISEEALPPCITIDDYLRAYLPGYAVTGYSTNPHGHLDQGGKFEKVIAEALEDHVDELLSGVRPDGVGDQLEIDMVIRCGNQVGIAELKDVSPRGEGPKRGIDQLTTTGSREYLGIYTRRFLITSKEQRRVIRKLAQEQQIKLIELVGYRRKEPLRDEHRKLLIQTIRQELLGD